MLIFSFLLASVLVLLGCVIYTFVRIEKFSFGFMLLMSAWLSFSIAVAVPVGTELFFDEKESKLLNHYHKLKEYQREERVLTEQDLEKMLEPYDINKVDNMYVFYEDPDSDFAFTQLGVMLVEADGRVASVQLHVVEDGEETLSLD